MAQRGLRVTGVDSSPTMISLCRSRLPDCEWIVADMRTLSLGRRFDGIVAWDSFFHLDHDDQRRMFDVFAKHAAAGASLMFNAGPHHGEAIGEYRGDPLYHASLAPDEYAALIDRFGFELIEHAANDTRAGGRTAWLCRSRHDA
jgi:cyclopropane fatty-acyl-phospholipid synthase-like methyltransferase